MTITRKCARATRCAAAAMLCAMMLGGFLAAHADEEKDDLGPTWNPPLYPIGDFLLQAGEAFRNEYSVGGGQGALSADFGSVFCSGGAEPFVSQHGMKILAALAEFLRWGGCRIDFEVASVNGHVDCLVRLRSIADGMASLGIDPKLFRLISLGPDVPPRVDCGERNPLKRLGYVNVRFRMTPSRRTDVAELRGARVKARATPYLTTVGNEERGYHHGLKLEVGVRFTAASPGGKFSLDEAYVLQGERRQAVQLEAVEGVSGVDQGEGGVPGNSDCQAWTGKVDGTTFALFRYNDLERRFPFERGEVIRVELRFSHSAGGEATVITPPAVVGDCHF